MKINDIGINPSLKSANIQKNVRNLHLNLNPSKILRHLGHSLLLRRHARLGLNLLQTILARPTTLPPWIDTLRVTTICHAAARTSPHVLPINTVGVFRRHVNLASVDGMVFQRLGTFPAPGFEAGAVRVIGYMGDHEVSQMAVFVGESVYEAVLIVDDALGELDSGVVDML